jgi:nucleotidyltransferase substrate binding protein (TIGR01987 family)
MDRIMQEKDIIITPLVQAKETFDRALNQMNPANDLERDGCIQRFEYCYELAWKTLKRILNARGIEVNSPKNTYREAAREGLITDPEIWFSFMDLRNLTVHTYNQNTAQQVYARLGDVQRELDKLVKVLQGNI